MPFPVCKITKLIMTLSLVFLIAVLIMPTYSLAKQAKPGPDEIPIELAQENEFVVKMMDVFDNSAKKIKNLHAFPSLLCCDYPPSPPS